MGRTSPIRYCCIFRGGKISEIPTLRRSPDAGRSSLVDSDTGAPGTPVVPLAVGLCLKYRAALIGWQVSAR